MIYNRQLGITIEKWIGRGKILIIYGSRQVGKTTLAKTLLARYGKEQDYYNCEILHIKQALGRQEPQELYSLFGGARCIVLDEAQKVPDIGSTLKIFHDAYPHIQIIATGSSSFELSNKISEPLTGRALEFILFPLSLQELSQSHSRIELVGKLEQFLRFGSYPEISLSSEKDAQILLDNITSKYLFQDILEHEQIKKSTLLVNLIQLLALQMGSEVSIHELAITLGVGRKTVERYLDLLEKAFVIFRLRPFSRNLRKEIGTKQKIYFYDLGIRNSLIVRYHSLHLRDDVGALWENFMIIERMKYLRYHHISNNTYFWRTHDQKEIDYIEEANGVLSGYEFKWNKNTQKKQKEFLATYQGSSVQLINKNNFFKFVLD